MEIIKNEKRIHRFKAAVFDFDGTISLIREGWQQVMIPYFTEELLKTPNNDDIDTISRNVRDFVDLLTGRQTIYQCIRLAEEIEKYGGVSKKPLEYKREYHRRLLKRIKYRIDGLREGILKPEDNIVPGSFEILEMFRKHGIVLYLASGTDENYVMEEASLLGVSKYFDGGIYGAKDQYKLFSKAMVMKNIIETHDLAGKELIGFGDGYVEIENIKSYDGFAVGVASDEANRNGIDEWKRERLIKAGADIIIPDFRQIKDIERHIFMGKVI